VEKHSLGRIKEAYEGVGRYAWAYDGMMANKSFFGRLAMRCLWGISEKNYPRFLRLAFGGIPAGFGGRLLEVPVGTGVLSLPEYQKLPQASVTCLDYSQEMLSAARERAEQMELAQVSFCQGDVGNLPFEDKSFDLVLSVNGFHVFPNKSKAYIETWRMLRRGGIFCGCMYVRGENHITDLFVRQFCQRHELFCPPYETAESLKRRLEGLYEQVELSLVGSFAGFVCRK